MTRLCEHEEIQTREGSLLVTTCRKCPAVEVAIEETHSYWPRLGPWVIDDD